MAIEYQDPEREGFSAIGLLKRRGRAYFDTDIYAGSVEDVLIDMEKFLQEFLKGNWDFEASRLSINKYSEYAHQLISHHEVEVKNMKRDKKERGIEYVTPDLLRVIREKNRLKRIVESMPDCNINRQKLANRISRLNKDIMYISDDMGEEQLENFYSQIHLPTEPGEVNIKNFKIYYPCPPCVKNAAQDYRSINSSKPFGPVKSENSQN